MEESKKLRKTSKEKMVSAGKFVRHHKGTFIQWGSLALVLIIFEILTGGRLLASGGTKIIYQVTPLIIMGTGVMFVYAHGGMDVSAGAVAGLSAAVAVIIINATGMVWLAILAAVLISVAGYLLMCVSSTKFGLMPIIASLALMFIFNGILNGIVNSSKYSGTIPLENYSLLLPLKQSIPLQLGVMITLLLISECLMNLTAFGKFDKAIGDNQLSARQSGAKVFGIKMASYAIAGLCVGISSVFLVAGEGEIKAGFGASYMLEVMIAIILGGMAISGGRETKISAIVVGAFTLRFIEMGLNICNLADYYGMIKGILFLIVVALTIRQSRSNKILP